MFLVQFLSLCIVSCDGYHGEIPQDPPHSWGRMMLVRKPRPTNPSKAIDQLRCGNSDEKLPLGETR